MFLVDVVLGGALPRAARDALLVGERDVEGEQPGGRRVYCHGRVHLSERDVLEQRAHVAEMGDRHADLADLAFGQRMIAVVAGLGGQVESDGKAGLSFGEVLATERVRVVRGRMAGIGAKDPRLVALPARAVRWLTHGALAGLALVQCNIVPCRSQGCFVGVEPSHRPAPARAASRDLTSAVGPQTRGRAYKALPALQVPELARVCGRIANRKCRRPSA